MNAEAVVTNARVVVTNVEAVVTTVEAVVTNTRHPDATHRRRELRYHPGLTSRFAIILSKVRPALARLPDRPQDCQHKSTDRLSA